MRLPGIFTDKNCDFSNSTCSNLLPRTRFLENFVGEVTKFCKDDLQKESFVEMFGTKKQIVFELYEAPSGSNRTRNDGGRLMLGTNKSNGWISGAYQIGKDLLTTCSGDAQLSISLRKNLRDFESHRVKNLGRISKAVGIDFELETPDFPSWFEVATPRNVHDDLGQMFYDWYLGGLADNLEKLCKDDMCKEAVAEACTKKMIKFVLGPKEQKGYGSCTFPDGVLVITLPPNNLPANVGELGKDIESQL